MRETIPQRAFEACARHASNIAVVDLDEARRVSFDELAAEVRDAAKAFIALGLAAGEAVGVWAPNGARWITAALAVQTVGGVIVPLNTRLRGREVAEIARRANIRALVTAGDFLGQDYPALLEGQDLPALRALVAVTGRRCGPAPATLDWPGFMAGAAEVSADRLAQRLAAVAPDDPADIMFTSGTTGLPKGAVFSHRKTLLAAETFGRLTRLAADDRYLPFGPFAHTASYKGGWLAALLAGATLYARNQVDAVATMRLVNEERISAMPAPPTVLQAILAHPDRAAFDLSSLRLVSTGGAVVPLELVRRLKSELGIGQVATGYGLTECGGTATLTRPDDPLEVVARSAGRAAPGVEIRCVRPDGADADAGEQGEVFIRAAKSMQGYLGDPQATAAAFTPGGWLRSGDLGWLDAAGNLTITDRLKDMYIVGGFNCYPAEVERELAAYPGVMHCAVIGVPDERLGEVGRAFIVPAPGAALGEAEILAWCKANFANYKAPRSVRFVDALPMNASGKVMKQVLRAAD